MARFSQAFLQGLLQPTYQQGLFEAARSVGQTPGIMRMERQEKEEQEKLQQLMTTGDPSQISARVQQLRQMAVQATSTEQRRKYTAAADALENNIKTKGIQDISVLMGELDKAVDPARIDALQQQISDLAVSSMQPDPTEFVGLGSKRKETVTELMEDQSEKRVENIASALARSSADIPTFVDSLPSAQDNPKDGVTEAERASIIKISTDLRGIRDDHADLAASGTLSPAYRKILDSNKELKERPEIKEALDILARRKDPESTVTPGQASRAADTIRNVVTAEYGRQLEVNRSTNRLEAKADRMVDSLLEEGGISEWVYGEDLVEVVRRVKDDDDLEDDFRSFIAQEIEKNPSVDKNVAIKTALDLLGEKYDLRLEEGRQQNIEEDAQEEADRETAIAALMERDDLSRRDAIRKLNELEAERRKGAGSIQDVRTRAREAQFGPSSYGALPEATRGQDPVTASEALSGVGRVGAGLLRSIPGGPPSRN